MNTKNKYRIWSENIFKKSDTQNLVDSILYITYPYVSEMKEWTSLRTVVQSSDQSMTIKVMPKFLPFGSEDQTEVIVGVTDVETGSKAVICYQSSSLERRVTSFLCSWRI